MQSYQTLICLLLVFSGLKTDPEKVRAVVDMPRPADKAGVQRLLGMANYVRKFIPNMSDLTSPLRQLLHYDVEWHWNTL